MSNVWVVTGGAGFIGSNFVRLALNEEWCDKVVVIDLLTYAGHRENLAPFLSQDNRLELVVADIADGKAMNNVIAQHKPEKVFHFAAESHVDRSIDDPAPFIHTNVLGTQVMLDAARKNGVERFIHVSTDEVYGSLSLDTTNKFHEDCPYAPNSPYAASKASADMLVRAAYHTYGQGVVITNCSNNYGPYQFPEKLIPLMITNAMAGKELPVYGDGLYVRDWIHVEDHCRAVLAVGKKGASGETYCIGSDNEQPNIKIVKQILAFAGRDESLIKYVKDRPGHDRRYAIDSGKIYAGLGWKAETPWKTGLEKTFQWYADNPKWAAQVLKNQ